MGLQTKRDHRRSGITNEVRGEPPGGPARATLLGWLRLETSTVRVCPYYEKGEGQQVAKGKQEISHLLEASNALLDILLEADKVGRVVRSRQGTVSQMQECSEQLSDLVVRVSAVAEQASKAQGSAVLQLMARIVETQAITRRLVLELHDAANQKEKTLKGTDPLARP